MDNTHDPYKRKVNFFPVGLWLAPHDMFNNKNIFALLVKPSKWATDGSRLPVVLDIVGGHDGMIHWVENDSIHIHRDRITGQHLWVVSYHNINTLPLAVKGLDSRWISAVTSMISGEVRRLWDLLKEILPIPKTKLNTIMNLHNIPQLNILKPMFISIS